MKRLLVTSDDFGMCDAVNRGIVLALREGIVRSTNLMAPCAWAFGALRLAKQYALPVGVHLCATSEWEAYRYRPLTDGRSLRRADGSFPASHEELASRVDYTELELEYRAQIEFVESFGVRPTHFDTHMIGAWDTSEHSLRIQAIVKKLATERNVPYTYEQATPGAPETRHFAAEFVMSPHSVEETMRVLESWSTPGTYHLVTHAAAPSEELSALAHDETSRGWAEYFRTKDLAFVTAKATREFLSERGFSLIDVRDL